MHINPYIYIYIYVYIYLYIYIYIHRGRYSEVFSALQYRSLGEAPRDFVGRLTPRPRSRKQPDLWEFPRTSLGGPRFPLKGWGSGPNPKGIQKNPNIGGICIYVYGLYTRNRTNGLGHRLCIWVLGPFWFEHRYTKWRRRAYLRTTWAPKNVK